MPKPPFPPKAAAPAKGAKPGKSMPPWLNKGKDDKKPAMKSGGKVKC